MNELTIFNFNGEEIRTVIINNEPYFVAKDVAEILDYSETEKMTRRLDEDEKTTIPFRENGSNYQTNITVINESGLFNAIIGSIKPEARQFKKWVTSEVLPQIRKTGRYQKALSIEEMTRLVIDDLNKKIDEQQKRIDNLIHTNKLYTASEISKELNMKSAKELNGILADMGIQYKVNETWVLTADYSNRGYTSIKQTELENGKIIYDRKWTISGREFLLELFGKTELAAV